MTISSRIRRSVATFCFVDTFRAAKWLFIPRILSASHSDSSFHEYFLRRTVTSRSANTFHAAVPLVSDLSVHWRYVAKIFPHLKSIRILVVSWPWVGKWKCCSLVIKSITNALDNFERIEKLNLTYGIVCNRLQKLKNDYAQFEQNHAKILASVSDYFVASYKYFADNKYSVCEAAFLAALTT